MKKPLIIVVFSTIYLVFFQLSPRIGVPDEAIIAMFILSPIVVLYVVYVVLKYGKPSKHSFDERFYEDVDYDRKDV